MNPDDFLGWDVRADKSQKYLPKDENGISTNSGEIYANDLGECIGLGIYDESRNEGYLSHLGTIGREKDDVMTQIMMLLESLPELEDPEILITGGSYPDINDNVETNFGDSGLRDTYHIGGLKTAIKRIMEQEFQTKPKFEQGGEKSTALYVDSNDGIKTEPSEMIKLKN